MKKSIKWAVLFILAGSCGGVQKPQQQLVIDHDGTTAENSSSDADYTDVDNTDNHGNTDDHTDIDNTDEHGSTDNTDSGQTDVDNTDIDHTDDGPRYPRMESDIFPDFPDYGDPTPTCLQPQTCRTLGVECGYANNSCNELLLCGACKSGQSCVDNYCVYACDRVDCAPDQYCQNNYYGALCRCQPGYYLKNGRCERQEHAEITLMAANITSGANQTYTGPGLRIFKGLKPDIVMIQEFNYDRDDDLDYGYTGMNELIYRVFGPEYSYFAGTGKIPNGIVSRYPIKAKGNWDEANTNGKYGNGDRDFAWAIIDIPGDIDLLAVSLHIKAGKSDDDKKARNSQNTVLLQKIEDKLGADIDNYYVAIGGDFNLTNRNEYAFTMLRKHFVTDAPYPADQNGNDYSNTNRDHPYDGVFVSPNLDAKEVPVKIGKSVYPNGLLFDSRVYTPLGEVAPVKVTDCEPYEEDGVTATNMQHMAVMRNFRLW